MHKNTKSLFRMINRVLYYTAGIMLISAMMLGLIHTNAHATAGGGDFYGNLRISDITCLASSKQVQIQFILNNVSGGAPGPSVSFTLKLNGGAIQTLSAPFISQTGGAYHYIYYGTTTGFYDVTGAYVYVGTHLVTLANPDKYSTQNNNCFSNATATPTTRPTNTPTVTKTSVPTRTYTPTATKTSVPTNTFTPTITNTSIPTNTFTPTVTNTSVPTDTFTPTVTDIPTNTPTDVPTNTPTDVPTTVVPPTDTPVPTTETSAPTDTPVPTTETSAPTDTPVPTTETVAPTETPVPTTETSAPTDTPVPTTDTAVPTTETPDSTKTSPPPIRVLQPVSVTLDPFCTVDGQMQWTIENPNNVSFTITGWSVDGGPKHGGFSAAPGSTKFTTTPLGTHTVTIYYGESQSASLTDTITVCPLPIPNTGGGLLIPVTGADQTNSLSQALLFGGLATGGLALILTALRKFLNL